MQTMTSPETQAIQTFGFYLAGTGRSSTGLAAAAIS
jgi:hypothetical protein